MIAVEGPKLIKQAVILRIPEILVQVCQMIGEVIVSTMSLGTSLNLGPGLSACAGAAMVIPNASRMSVSRSQLPNMMSVFRSRFR